MDLSDPDGVRGIELNLEVDILNGNNLLYGWHDLNLAINHANGNPFEVQQWKMVAFNECREHRRMAIMKFYSKKRQGKIRFIYSGMTHYLSKSANAFSKTRDSKGKFIVTQAVKDQE